MQKKTLQLFLWIFIIVLLSACIPVSPDLNATATQTAASPPIPTPTATVSTLPVPSTTALGPSLPTQLSQASMQLLAYVNQGQLLVTDVTGGVQGGTTQYTVKGASDEVSDIVWSPSGEFVAFVSTAQGDPHLFYVFALGQSSPIDIGPGSAPVWSPDSQSIAYIGGSFPNDNIWVIAIDNPAPRQLTFETNYAWGRPVFVPDGASLVVAGTDRINMGASGNTTFSLESLALDGSGARTPLTGATPFEGGRLPYDMRFSPDGFRLAFSTSFHLSACASPGAYYVSNPDGSNRQELVSPSLKSAIDTAQEHYHVGLSYAWTPAGDALIGLGNVVDCNLSSPNQGQIIAGPQMSILGLDGSERTIIPGFFYGISMDRMGTLIAAAHFEDGFQDLDPTLEVYSAETGQLALTLGPGSSPQFQP